MALRILTGCLLILAGLVHLALAGGYFVSSRYAAQEARTDAGDLSEVSDDIIDQQTLQRERAASAPRVKRAAMLRKLVAAIALLVMGLAQLGAAILQLMQRRLKAVRAVAGLSVLLWAGLLFAVDFSLVVGVAMAMVLLALLLPLLIRVAPRSAA